MWWVRSSFTRPFISPTADGYLELAQRYPTSLNGGVRSTLDSDISQNLVNQTDACDGPDIGDMISDSTRAGFSDSVFDRNRAWMQ